MKIYSFVINTDLDDRKLTEKQVEEITDQRMSDLQKFLKDNGLESQVGGKNYMRMIGALNIECTEKVYEELKRLPYLKEVGELDVEIIKPVKSRPSKAPGKKFGR